MKHVSLPAAATCIIAALVAAPVVNRPGHARGGSDPAVVAGQPEWRADYPSAQAEARRSGKPILLVFR